MSYARVSIVFSEYSKLLAGSVNIGVAMLNILQISIGVRMCVAYLNYQEIAKFDFFPIFNNL